MQPNVLEFLPSQNFKSSPFILSFEEKCESIQPSVVVCHFCIGWKGETKEFGQDLQDWHFLNFLISSQKSSTSVVPEKSSPFWQKVTFKFCKCDTFGRILLAMYIKPRPLTLGIDYNDPRDPGLKNKRLVFHQKVHLQNLSSWDIHFHFNYNQVVGIGAYFWFLFFSRSSSKLSHLGNRVSTVLVEPHFVQ